MSLFKKNTCGCCCNASAPTPCCGEKVSEITSVKVLGAGCASCHKQYENVKEAVRTLGLDVEVEYVTDMAKVVEYGVMSMPAIVVNEKVVSAGKVLKSAYIQQLFLAKLQGN